MSSTTGFRRWDLRKDMHANVHHSHGEQHHAPGDTDKQYLLFDRETKFSAAVLTFLSSCGIAPARTSYQSPWQNGIAERWVRSFRNELLDQVIVLDERHLRRIGQDYIRYYHHDRTHDGLDKETPIFRSIVGKNDDEQLESTPRLSGLHHRYYWAKAA